MKVSRQGWQDKPGQPVTVIIPTFNRRDILLSRALPSVLMQTHERTLTVVVAHGCTDGTADVVRSIRDPRVRVLEIPRVRRYPPTAENHWLVGPVDPLNAGLDVVQTPWTARIDDDDMWEPDHLQKLLRFASSGGHEFVSSAHDTPSGKVSPYELADGTLVGGCQTWVYRSYLRKFRYTHLSIHKSWNRNNDTDLQDRMWRAGVRMGYHDEVTCHIWPRPGEQHIGSVAYARDCGMIEEKYAFSA